MTSSSTMSTNSHFDFNCSRKKTNPMQILQVVLSCVLMFTTGATFALGVFTVAVENYNTSLPIDSVPGLQGCWPFGMGMMHLLSAPVLIVSGFVLDESRQKRLDHLLRNISIGASAAFALFSLCALGVFWSNRLIITAGLAMQSVPLGVFYPLVTEHLFTWMPHTPGLAIGLCQLAFGLGSVIMAWIFNYLTITYGVVAAIFMSAISMALLTGIPSVFLSWPASDEYVINNGVDYHVNNSGSEKERDDVSSSSEENEALLKKKTSYDQSIDETCSNTIATTTDTRHLRWDELLRSYQFWLYIIAVLTAGVSYAFIPYYFKLGCTFSVSMPTLVMTFQVTGLAATLFGLLASIWTDTFTFGSGFFSSGSKNMMLLFLVCQTLLCFILIVASRANLFIPFVVAVACMKMIMAAHAGCAALIARDFFGTRNSCVVFGIGGGLALGGGEGLSAFLMAFIESHTSSITGQPAIQGVLGSMSHPTRYESFYWIAGIWSVIGTVSLLALTKYRKASVSQEIRDNEQDCTYGSEIV